MIRALKEVFRNFRYVLIVGIGALAAFTFAVWLPNLSLIANTFGKSNVSLGIKAQLLWGLFESITTNFSTFSASYTIAIAILFGINLSLAIYLLKRTRALQQGGVVAGAGGAVSGMFGIGCAACGSFLTTSILSFFGAGGAIALLPFKGGEFGVLSILLLVASIFLAARSITVPLVCSPNTILKNHE